MTYYSIWDSQCGTFLHTGRNSRSKKSAIEAGFEYLTNDWNNEDIKEAKTDKEGTLKTCDLIIEKHTKKLPEGY